MNYQILATELTSGHPDTGAYDADARIAADQLNAVNRTRSRETVTGAEIFNATDDSEFDSLQSQAQDRWVQLCQIQEIDTSNGIAKALEAAIFGPGTQTRTNLIAIKNESISRAEELGLRRVRAGDVIHARAL